MDDHEFAVADGPAAVGRRKDGRVFGRARLDAKHVEFAVQYQGLGHGPVFHSAMEIRFMSHLKRMALPTRTAHLLCACVILSFVASVPQMSRFVRNDDLLKIDDVWQAYHWVQDPQGTPISAPDFERPIGKPSPWLKGESRLRNPEG